eukprot:1163169-Rhodomonas_salina.2
MLVGKRATSATIILCPTSVSLWSNRRANCSCTNGQCRNAHTPNAKCAFFATTASLAAAKIGSLLTSGRSNVVCSTCSGRAYVSTGQRIASA